MSSNTAYIEAVKAYEVGRPKDEYDMHSDTILPMFFDVFARITGSKFGPNDTVLDFGCGGGNTVRYLVDSGYNAFGVDILEYWGKDAELNGALAVREDNVRQRLFAINPNDNKLPFDSNSLALVVSNQTMEHVFDYPPVFAEQYRVLRPGGIAIHRFPHGHTRREPHTAVPIATLTRYHWYLALWARLGRRNSRQLDLNWRETLESNIHLMDSCNYVSKGRMLRDARKTFPGDVWFDSFLDLEPSQAGRLYRSAKAKGMGAVAAPMLKALLENRMLILRKPLAA